MGNENSSRHAWTGTQHVCVGEPAPTLEPFVWAARSNLVDLADTMDWLWGLLRETHEAVDDELCSGNSPDYGAHYRQVFSAASTAVACTRLLAEHGRRLRSEVVPMS